LPAGARLPTVFLFAFFGSFLSFFFLKGKRERNERKN